MAHIRTRWLVVATVAPLAYFIAMAGSPSKSATGQGVVCFAGAVFLCLLSIRLVKEARQRREPLLLAAWASPLIPVLFCEMALIWIALGRFVPSTRQYEGQMLLLGEVCSAAGLACGVLGLCAPRINRLLITLVPAILGLLLNGWFGFFFFSLSLWKD
jgi:hypothetical protein